jgi:hypothetical protein
MYFPAVPISDLSDPARYRTLPRRSHLYLGETVRFLLVLRCKDVPSGGTPTDLLGKTFMWIENERMNLEYRHIFALSWTATRHIRYPFTLPNKRGYTQTDMLKKYN